MKLSPSQTLIRHVQSWLASRSSDEGSDQELLRRFVESENEQAFLALVQRYGPLVLRVCQRQLHDAGEADDAFQATFLVLARKAPFIQKRQSVASWLYGVAYRVARRLRQRQRLVLIADLDRSQPSAAKDTVNWQETVALLDEELHRLAEKYRLPLVLHYLQGQDQLRVAKQLGWPLRTTERRLAQGRELLRQRLVRRGVELAMVPLALELSVNEVPAALVQQAAAAATAYAVGEAAVNGAGSAKVLALAEEVMVTLTTTKLKLAVIFSLVLTFCGIGAVVSYVHVLGGQTGSKKPQMVAENPPALPGSDADMTLWNGAGQSFVTGELPGGTVLRLGTPRQKGRSPAVDCVAISPDGKTIAAGSGDGMILLWDRASARLLRQSIGARLWDVADASKPKNLELGTDFQVVSQIGFSPDGKILASGTAGAFTLWDLATGRQLEYASGQGGRGFLSTIHREGNHILGNCSFGGIFLATRNGQAIQTTATHTGFRGFGFAFTPDGKQVVSVDRRMANEDSENWWFILYDVATHKVVREFRGATESTRVEALARDGKTLAATDEDGNVSLWDVATGKELLKIAGNDAGRACAALAPDGKTLVTGGKDKTARVWRVESGQELFSLKHDDAIIHLAFSPDGKTLAVGGEKAVRVWEVATRKERGQLPWPITVRNEDPNWEGSHFAWTPTGDALALGTSGGAVHLHSIDTGRKRSFALPGHSDAVLQVAFSAAGTELFSWGKDRGLREWDLATASELRICQGEQKRVNCAAFFPDGKMLVALDGDQTLRLWNTATGKEVRQLDGHPGWVRWVTVSPDGRTIAAGSEDQTIRLWDAKSGAQMAQLEGHSGSIRCVVFSPDGKTLASTGEDNVVRLWDLATGKKRGQIEALGTNRQCLPVVAFSPDGKHLAAVAPNGTPTLWEAATGMRVREFADFKVGECGFVFSPDGKKLVIAVSSMFQVINLATGQSLKQVSLRHGEITCLVFSPDGGRLATGSEDGTILIWAVRGGE